MTDIASDVTRLVDRYDVHPGNGTPEMVRSDTDPAQLLADYRQFVTASIAPSDVESFHRANGVLFDYLPPELAQPLFRKLTAACRSWNNSSLCVPVPPCGAEQKTPGANALLYRSFADLKKYPTIGLMNQAHWFLEICGLIAAIQQSGETAFADHLQTALFTGHIRMIADGAKGGGIVPAPQPDTVFIGNPFAGVAPWEPVETWGEWVDRLSPGFYRGAQFYFEVMGMWCKGTVAGEQDIDPCMQKEYGVHWQQARLFAQQRLPVWGASEQSNRVAMHTAYYGDTPLDALPREFPMWMLVLMHEYRHVEQNHMAALSPTPAWAPEALRRGFQYAHLFIRDFSLAIDACDNREIPNQGYFSIVQEAVTGQWIAAMKDASEKDATRFSMEIAQKIVRANAIPR